MPTLQERDFKSFEETSAGDGSGYDSNWARRVSVKNTVLDPIPVNVVSGGGSSSNPFAPPSGTDWIDRTVVSNVETFYYKMGGTSGTLLKTVVVTYAADDLEEFVSAGVT